MARKICGSTLTLSARQMTGESFTIRSSVSDSQTYPRNRHHCYVCCRERSSQRVLAQLYKTLLIHQRRLFLEGCTRKTRFECAMSAVLTPPLCVTPRAAMISSALCEWIRIPSDNTNGQGHHPGFQLAPPTRPHVKLIPIPYFHSSARTCLLISLFHDLSPSLLSRKHHLHSCA